MPISELVVFAGQSNALGFGLDGGDLPAGYGARDVFTYIWNNADGGWEVFEPGVNTGTPANPGAWGPEVAFAYEWRQDHAVDDALYIVKSAKGSTSLAENPAGQDWSPDSTGELFDLTADRIAAARASFGALDPGVEAVMWMQGETDATNAGWASAYEANLREFIGAARDEWMGDTAGHIGLGRISDSPALAYSSDVRIAQWDVDLGDDPIAGVDSFKTLDLAMQADALHYDAAGAVGIGTRFYGLFEAWA